MEGGDTHTPAVKAPPPPSPRVPSSAPCPSRCHPNVPFAPPSPRRSVPLPVPTHRAGAQRLLAQRWVSKTACSRSHSWKVRLWVLVTPGRERAPVQRDRTAVPACPAPVPHRHRHSPYLQWSCTTRRLAWGLSRMRHFPTVFSSEGSERKTPRKDLRGRGMDTGEGHPAWSPHPRRTGRF